MIQWNEIHSEIVSINLGTGELCQTLSPACLIEIGTTGMAQSAAKRQHSLRRVLVLRTDCALGRPVFCT